MQVPAGTYVRHRRYGVGRVLGWDRGLFPRVRVRFEDGEDRALDVDPATDALHHRAAVLDDPPRHRNSAGAAVMLADGVELEREAGFSADAGRIVFTIGYERRSLEEIIAALREHDVGILVDIREAPFSKRRGFSHAELREACRRAGIGYELKREWGNPRRKEGGVGPRLNLRLSMTRYTEHLAPHIVEAAAFIDRIVERRPAFLCYEAEPFHCHRSRFTSLVLPHCRSRPAVHHILPPPE